MQQLRLLCDVSDFVCLQELRGVQYDVAEFGHFLPGWRWRTSTMGDGCSGGVAILVSPAAQERWRHMRWEVVVPGRVCLVHVWDCLEGTRGDELYVANVHVVLGESGSLASQLGRLLRRMPSADASESDRPGVGIILGGFNRVDIDEGRLHSPSGRIIYDIGRVASSVASLLDSWAEGVAPGHGHWQFRDGELDTLSRIDCVFLSCGATDLQECRAKAQCTVDVCSVKMSSEHAPLLFTAALPQEGRRGTTPSWVCRHPAFAAAVSRHSARADWTDYGPFEALKARKVILSHAACEVMQVTPAISSAEDGIRRRARSLTTTQQHVLKGRWAQLSGMRNILGPKERVFFDEAHMRDRVDEMDFAVAMRAALWDLTMLELLEADAEGHPSEHRAAMRAKADRTMRAWRPCRRRIVAMTVLREEDEPAASYAEEVECLEAH